MMQVDRSVESFRIPIYILFALAIALYLLQAFSPLRLNSDSIYYLSMADSAAAGHRFVRHQQPIGYPVFIFLLIKAGIFCSATMVLANFLFLLAGLRLSYQTLLALNFSRSQSLCACLFTLLSFTVVKHVTLGMSDFLFFALSACACWTITRSGWWKWLALAVCFVCAVEVRFIGLSLIFPMAAIAFPRIRKNRTALVLAGMGLVLALGVGFWAGHNYFSDNLKLLHRFGIPRFIVRAVVNHSQDFGELALNAPVSKLPPLFHSFVIIVGLCAMLLFFVGTVKIWRQSQWLPLYLLGGCLLIFPWPYSDPRFWLHVMPFVYCAMGLGLSALIQKMNLDLKSMARIIPLAYAVAFCSLGVLALGYSTWLTFSGSQFPYRYGDGMLRPVYLAGCSSQMEDPAQSLALHLLQEYEWHCPATPQATGSLK